MTEVPPSTAPPSALDRAATDPSGAACASIRAPSSPVCFLSPLSVWRSGVSRAPNRCSCREKAASTRIDIAARVSGRLAKIAVSRGQNVAAGATLLVIDNPELVAELRQAEAEKTVADAELQRIKVGTRAEIIAQRKAEIDRAPADLTLGQQTNNRTKQLADAPGCAAPAAAR